MSEPTQRKISPVVPPPSKKSTTSKKKRHPNVPASLHAFKAGWKHISMTSTPFMISDESYMMDYSNKASLIGSFSAMSNGIEKALISRGLDVDEVNIYQHLAASLVHLITDYTKQELVQQGSTKLVSINEMWQFLGTLMLRSIQVRLSTEDAFDWISCFVRGKFELMPVERFTNILYSLRGFDVSLRSPQDNEDSWMDQSNLLRNLSNAEVKAFEQSRACLMNTENGQFVVDDELIASGVIHH